jgi:hypothetical protein
MEALNRRAGKVSTCGLSFPGSGYPEHRKAAQKESRDILACISRATHLSFAQILIALPEKMVLPVLEYPGLMELMDIESIEEPALRDAFFRKGIKK